MSMSDTVNTRRIELLRHRMRELDLDAYVSRHTSDIRWLTGFTRVFDSEQAHVVLVTEHQALLHTDFRYAAALRVCNGEGVWDISEEPIGHARFVAKTLGASSVHYAEPYRIGIEGDIPLNVYRAFETALGETALGGPGGVEDGTAECFELVALDDVVTALRAVKDGGELWLHRQAQAITDRAFEHMIAWMRLGQSEIEAQLELECFMRSDGSQGLAFPSIIASGPNGANPHAIPSERRFQAGDLVVMDFGARYLDYCADMTRTVIFGAPTEQQRSMYDTVLAAHERAKGAIHGGVTGEAIHAIAAEVIDAAGFQGRFGHAIGHGVGIDIHEFPSLGPRSEHTLEAGNVVTIEPGIYIPDVGGVRIEDFGAVTEEGFSCFTSSPHELIVL